MYLKMILLFQKKITEQIDFGMHTTVLIYVLNVGLGGGELKSIYKNMFVEFPCPLYPLYLHIFFPIILEKDLIDKKKSGGKQHPLLC